MKEAGSMWRNVPGDNLLAKIQINIIFMESNLTILANIFLVTYPTGKPPKVCKYINERMFIAA